MKSSIGKALAVVALIACVAVLASPRPSAAVVCRFSAVLEPVCDGACFELYFGVDQNCQTYTVVLQQRVGSSGSWVTVDSSYTSGETYCPSSACLGCDPFQYRLVISCSPCGLSSEQFYGEINCP